MFVCVRESKPEVTEATSYCRVTVQGQYNLCDGRKLKTTNLIVTLPALKK